MTTSFAQTNHHQFVEPSVVDVASVVSSVIILPDTVSKPAELKDHLLHIIMPHLHQF